MNLIIIFLFVLYGQLINASNVFPEVGRVYNDNEIPRVEISINPEHLSNLLDPSNVFLDDLYPVQFKWIELYNPGSQLVLTDLYLSDDIDTSDKWKIADHVIDEKGYYLIWADDDSNQGLNHANFKLNKLGEGIYLYLKKGKYFVIMDELLFPELNSEYTYGRYPDGSDSFILMDLPTPNTSNTNERGSK